MSKKQDYSLLIIDLQDEIQSIMREGFKKHEAQELTKLIILSWVRYMIDIDYRFSQSYPLDFNEHFKIIVKHYSFSTTDHDYLLSVANRYVEEIVKHLHEFSETLTPMINILVIVKGTDARIFYD